MEYETSYDIGSKPFNHDRHRGKWESSKDFLFVCIGHAFRLDTIIVLPFMMYEMMGISVLIPYFLMLAVCVVPIVLIQTFLGQFSSTGFISVFRIAPLFKGIGYVSLAVNFVNLTFYSIFSAIPLLYMFYSLMPTIPWSCEGAKEWMNINRTICSEERFTFKSPSYEFFKEHFNIPENSKHNTMTFSLELVIFTVIVWGIVTFLLLKSTEVIGRLLRYSVLTVFTIMGLLMIRCVFIPGAIESFLKSLNGTPRHKSIEGMWLIIPMVFSTLGPGWGSILTMASFNDFKANINKSSWIICLAQMGVFLGMGLITFCLNHIVNGKFGKDFELAPGWISALMYPTSLTLLEFPRLWSLLFFGILLLGSLNLLVVQLLALLTSIFDEFEDLRDVKKQVTFGIVGVLFLCSLFFCSYHGVFFFEVLLAISGMMQLVLNLLLLLVVLWIYGRERFQRDLNFMTSQIYSTWMVYVVRFISPMFILVGLLLAFFMLILNLIFHRDPHALDGMYITIGVFFCLLSWCFIPGYCIVKINQTAGKICIRLKRCVRPTDWYPADPIYKQSYEERFSTTDTSHPLTILAEE